jgi:hypothetical protein
MATPCKREVSSSQQVHDPACIETSPTAHISSIHLHIILITPQQLAAFVLVLRTRRQPLCRAAGAFSLVLDSGSPPPAFIPRLVSSPQWILGA